MLPPTVFHPVRIPENQIISRLKQENDHLKQQIASLMAERQQRASHNNVMMHPSPLIPQSFNPPTPPYPPARLQNPVNHYANPAQRGVYIQNHEFTNLKGSLNKDAVHQYTSPHSATQPRLVQHDAKIQRRIQPYSPGRQQVVHLMMPATTVIRDQDEQEASYVKRIQRIKTQRSTSKRSRESKDNDITNEPERQQNNHNTFEKIATGIPKRSASFEKLHNTDQKLNGSSVHPKVVVFTKLDDHGRERVQRVKSPVKSQSAGKKSSSRRSLRSSSVKSIVSQVYSHTINPKDFSTEVPRKTAKEDDTKISHIVAPIDVEAGVRNHQPFHLPETDMVRNSQPLLENTSQANQSSRTNLRADESSRANSSTSEFREFTKIGESPKKSVKFQLRKPPLPQKKMKSGIRNDVYQLDNDTKQPYQQSPPPVPKKPVSKLQRNAYMIEEQ